MALERDQKAGWKAALRAESSPFVAFGLDATVPLLSDRLAGLAGLIDWHLHGQVSRLLAEGTLPPEEFCLVPTGAGAQNFLLYHYGDKPDPQAFVARARKLKVERLSLAAATFPKDFLSKLEQNLKKEGIPFTHLEP